MRQNMNKVVVSLPFLLFALELENKMASISSDNVEEEKSMLLSFPCEMLCLLFVEANDHEGEIWYLDILTDVNKHEFVNSLKRALNYLEDTIDQLCGNYFIDCETITFENHVYYDGYVAAKKKNTQ
jgi:hypothetical protein